MFRFIKVKHSNGEWAEIIGKSDELEQMTGTGETKRVGLP